MDVLSPIGDGLCERFQMAWEVWWALVLGFLLSGIVQAWAPRDRLERALGGGGPGTIALATGLGAASSSCSYAAVAIAKSLFQKGASLASAMVFQFASTNLVFELGIVIWIFLGWQFTLAELVGGLMLIVLMWIGVRAARLAARGGAGPRRAQAVERGHQHHSAGGSPALSLEGWSDVAHNFRGDWQMLWKEIGAGFLIAGFVALLPKAFFNSLFLTGHGGDAAADRERGRRAARGRALVRLLGREHAARGGALGRRDLVRGRDRLHLRRPDHHPAGARSTAATTAGGWRASSSG